MNSLLDFAGLLLYYVFLPIIVPMQLFLYALAGVYFAVIFLHRTVLSVPHLLLRVRTAIRSHSGRMYVPAWRKKLVKVHA